jgi:hypothetical protein
MRNGKSSSFVFALLFLCTVSVVSTHAEPLPPYQWRCADRGGVNVLYCYLRANGVACEYLQLVKEQMEETGGKIHTAVTLMHLAAKNSLPLQAFSLTMSELKACTMPVIVHIDGETPEAGAFLLVLDINDKEIYFVSGPSASVQSISAEDFRRAWSGVALLPVTSWKGNAILWAIGFGVGLVLPTFIWRTRSK